MIIVVALLCVLTVSGRREPPQGQMTPGQSVGKPAVREPVAPKVLDVDLRQLARVKVYKAGDEVRVIEDLKESSRDRTESQPRGREPVAPAVMDTDVRRLPPAKRYQPGDRIRVMNDLREVVEPAAALGEAAQAEGDVLALLGSFDGIPATGSLPPDTVGDVGPNHYVQMVNTAFAIYDKTGNLLAGPSPINSLWGQFGGPCETQNNGDPVVRYDHLADRWVLSQFALPGGAAGFHQCFAVSRTPDPVAGGWFLYDFPTVDTASGSAVFPDYPKIGVWTDGYYMGTQRGFPSGGLDVWAFERAKMLNGQPAASIQFAVPAPSLFLLPSDLDGPPPAAGTPNFFARQVDGERFGGADRVEVFAFAANWANPALSTFTMLTSLPTSPFDSVLCSASLIGTCIPQPGTAQRLETLTVWPMWRLQFRHFGTHQTLVFNHTVDADGQDRAGIRWYELRRPPAGVWSIFQQGTHSPDATHRWMGSVAMNKGGYIALGYSVSSSTVFPGIRYAGRSAADPPGTFPAGEVNIIAGGGSQTHSSSRWGNYSSMDVDPTDDCTFWYTTEYYETTSPAGWKTRISNFRDASCTPPPSDHPSGLMYSAKVVCGPQKDPRDMRLARGFYATTINIHNPQSDSVAFTKKLALTYPPDEQQPGKVMPISRDKLGPDQALKVDCMDLRKRLFPRGFPANYIEGFVVIESKQSLDVVAVYTTAALDPRTGEATTHSSIDVERVPERRLGIQGASPDLIPVPDPRGFFCKTKDGKLVVTVRNQGAGRSAPSQTEVDFGSLGRVSQPTPALDPGASTDLLFNIPPGCFQPDCRFKITVDAMSDVPETNEANNIASDTCIG